MKKDLKILIVDDEPAMREVIGLILREYTVFEAANGMEAVERVGEHKPDLVLMDIMMPEMDGVESTKQIMSKYPGTKIVGVTAYATHKGKEIIEAGALEILEKPFRKKELEALIERVTGTKRITQEA